MMSGRLFPLFCTSAPQNIGVQPLLDAIVAYAPSPIDRPRRDGTRGRGPRRRGARSDAPDTAFVWKTVADPFAGRITLFRVVSGRSARIRPFTTSRGTCRTAPPPL